jgi:hypothetical protein
MPPPPRMGKPKKLEWIPFKDTYTQLDSTASFIKIQGWGYFYRKKKTLSLKTERLCGSRQSFLVEN